MDDPTSKLSPIVIRSACRAAEKTVETHVRSILGKLDLPQDGDGEPLMSYATDVDAVYEANDFYLLGIAHRRCRDEALRRLEARQAKLPDDLPELLIDDHVASLPWPTSFPL